MREALRSANPGSWIYAGDVWIFPDHLLTFADEDPEQRTLHETRYVLVMQGDDAPPDSQYNANCPTILIAPLSSQVQNLRPWEVRIEPEQVTPRIGRPSLIKIHLTQPVSRSVFDRGATKYGELDRDALEVVQLRLIDNLGI